MSPIYIILLWSPDLWQAQPGTAGVVSSNLLKLLGAVVSSHLLSLLAAVVSSDLLLLTVGVVSSKVVVAAGSGRLFGLRLSDTFVHTLVESLAVCSPAANCCWVELLPG